MNLSEYPRYNNNKMSETIFSKINLSCSLDAATINHTLNCILNTCCQLSKDRGYTHVNVYEPHQACIQQSPVIKANNDNGEEFLIFWHNEDRVGIKFIRQIDELQTKNQRNVLLVSLEGPTAFSKKECDSRPWLQLLTYKELYFNVSHHNLVPPHRKLTNEEKVDLRKRFSLSDADPNKVELPKMLVTDAISKYYKYERGDFIEITRTAGTLESVKTYRVVI